MPPSRIDDQRPLEQWPILRSKCIVPRMYAKLKGFEEWLLHCIHVCMICKYFKSDPEEIPEIGGVFNTLESVSAASITVEPEYQERERGLVLFA